MATYYFHFRDGRLLPDAEGQELADDAAAMNAAETLAYELAGEFGPGASIIVTKEECRDPLIEIRIEDCKKTH